MKRSLWVACTPEVSQFPRYAVEARGGLGATLKQDSSFPLTEVTKSQLDELCEVFQVRQGQELQTTTYFAQKDLDLPRCRARVCLQD